MRNQFDRVELSERPKEQHWKCCVPFWYRGFKSLTLRQPLRAQKRLFKAVSELSLFRRVFRVLYRVLYRHGFSAFKGRNYTVSSKVATLFNAFSFAF